MDSIQQLIETPPFSLDNAAKEDVFRTHIRALTQRHYSQCRLYRDLMDRIFGGEQACHFERLEDAPFLPVSLFKTQELCSVPKNEVLKVLTSSGTTGQAVSKIYLDRATSQAQSAVLVKIMQHFLGKQRLPMIILDHPGVFKDPREFSARGAGIRGLSQFGRKPFYALRDESMELDVDGLLAYLSDAKGERVFLFGFTFMVWQYFIRALEQRGLRVPLDNALLIHSGGWKKLTDQAVDAATFRRRVLESTGIQRVVNFYGMVEQVGSVFFENELHYLHCPIFSHVIIRDPATLRPLPPGETGLVQVLSVLPGSYPGHSLLTEDLGTIRGCDHSSLEMRGTYFEILGRVPKSENRGCSDTFTTPALPVAA